mgnify:CR=1 FL=1
MAHTFQRFEASTAPPNDDLQMTRKMACRKSHTKVLKQNLNSTKHIHILEDDITLCTNYPIIIDKLLTQMPHKWDILYTGLSLFENYKNILHLIQARNKNTINIIEPKQQGFYGAFAYFIHKRSINKIYSILKVDKSNKAIDVLLLEQINNGNIIAYSTFPTLVKHSYTFDSTIDNKNFSDRGIVNALYQDFFYIHYNQLEMAQKIEKVGKMLGYNIQKSVKITNDTTTLHALTSLRNISDIKQAGIFTQKLVDKKHSQEQIHLFSS